MTFKNVDEIGQAMLAGKIRTFKEQNDTLIETNGRVTATMLERDARLTYVRHIITNPNPTILP